MSFFFTCSGIGKATAILLAKQGVRVAALSHTAKEIETGATAYSVTKAGEVTMAKMLAVELAQQNVRENVICPGMTDTEINANTQKRDVEQVKFPVPYPQGQVPLDQGEPVLSQQVAELVMFLVSDAAKHITGTEVGIDGGSSLITG